MIRTSLTEIAR